MSSTTQQQDTKSLPASARHKGVHPSMHVTSQTAPTAMPLSDNWSRNVESSGTEESWMDTVSAPITGCFDIVALSLLDEPPSNDALLCHIGSQFDDNETPKHMEAFFNSISANSDHDRGAETFHLFTRLALAIGFDNELIFDAP